MAYDPVTVANLALAELAASPMTSFADRTPEAREMARWYNTTLGEMLSSHAWTWARQRVTLAEVTNDRPSDWQHAYAMPTDDVFPISIVLTSGIATGYTPLAGQTIATPLWGSLSVDPLRIDYVIAEGKLYCNRAGAVLEYTTTQQMEGVFTPLFVRAFSLELAARACYAITKSRDMKGDLIKQAEAAKQRAMASDLNQTPNRYGQFISESDLARGTGINWNDNPPFWAVR